MVTHLLLALLAAAPSTEVVRTLDLGRLTFAEANRLDGRPVRVSFVVNSLPDVLDRTPVANAAGDRGASRSVRFAPGIRVGRLRMGERVTVEGVMQARIIIPAGRPRIEIRHMEIREALPVSP